MNILEIKNLTKKYGNTLAINNLTVSIQKHKVVGILGPNGSGKTTTIACILGITLPNNGTFKWFNKPEGILVNQRIGAIIEQPNFYPYLSATENLKFVATIKNIKKPDNKISQVLKRVNLFDQKNKTFSSFSYGMKRRLSLAATILGDPEILILDEPTNGLDPQGIAFVRKLILEEAKIGKTIIIASHILDEVEKICTDVIILKNGNMIAQGKVDEVLKEKEKIIINSDNNEKLHELLIRNNIAKTAKINNNDLIVTLQKNIEPIEISKIAYNNKILFSKLETKKKNLETEFLKLVK